MSVVVGIALFTFLGMVLYVAGTVVGIVLPVLSDLPEYSSSNYSCDEVDTVVVDTEAKRIKLTDRCYYVKVAAPVERMNVSVGTVEVGSEVGRLEMYVGNVINRGRIDTLRLSVGDVENEGTIGFLKVSVGDVDNGGTLGSVEVGIGDVRGDGKIEGEVSIGIGDLERTGGQD